IYIGVGAKNAVSFMIEGDDTEGLLDPLEFLYEAKAGKITKFGKNVVIIGGGNTAMDAARTAYRLVGKNGKVTVLYRRTIQQMPAEYQEIKDVLAEGIEIKELVNPVKINSENGKIISLTCRRMKLGEKDASGRARPVEIPDSDFEFETDTVIPAIGQQLAVDFADKKLLKTEESKYETKIANVFIGGDAKRNASTLIKAIGDGRKAAQEIINKAGIDFNTKTNSFADRKQHSVKELMLKKTKRIPGIPVKEIDLNDRKNFKLVTATMTSEEAVAEASRCLLCDEVCNVCTTLCPNLALQHYEVESIKFKLQKIENGKIVDDDIFEITQKEQIIHIADWCNMCANCETFCPSSGAPYKEKPHLYLNKTTFAAEKDGYYYDNKNQTLLAKESGFDFSLTEKDNFYLYQSDNLIAKLDKKTFEITDYTGAENEDYDLKKAAEMSIILKGAEKITGN
ncbi:MAG: FAD-dependent oxidoreductase, partial [Bacteroidales bacterium]|nr:FAD-dependent oxidoreductase [Bacteroidales bacterium]